MGTATYVGAGSRRQGQGAVNGVMDPSLSAAAGDRHLLITGWKRTGTQTSITSNIDDGQGNTWTKVVDRVQVGTGTDGTTVDIGPMKINVWEKPYAVGEAAPTVNLVNDGVAPGANDGWSGWTLTYRPATGETLSFAYVGAGSDTSSGTGFSATTGASAVPLATDDLVAAVMMSSRDDVAPSARTITGTGLTFGTVQGRVGAANTAGNDSWLGLHDRPITAGSGSPAVAVTATLAFASTGGAAVIRIRSESTGTSLNPDGAASVADVGSPGVGGPGAGAPMRRLIPLDATKPATADPDTASTNVGIEFSVSEESVLTEVHWYQAASGGNTNQRQWGLYSVTNATSGTLISSGTCAATSGTGWQTTSVGPITLTAGQRYRLVIRHPAGKYAATGSYFIAGGPGASGYTDGQVTTYSNATATGTDQCSYVYNGSLAYPTESFNGANYWTDATITLPSGPSVMEVGAQGVASVAALGSLALDQSLTITDGVGPGSQAVVGTPTLALTAPSLELTPSGLASAAALGSPVVGLGALGLVPGGIGSPAGVGAPTVQSLLSLIPAGLGSPGSVGAPSLVIVPPSVLLTPSGLESPAVVGNPSLGFGALGLSPAGVASLAAPGVPSLGHLLVAAPSGVAGVAGVGSAVLTSVLNILAVGVVSVASPGAPVVGLSLNVVGGGLGSPSGVGIPVVTAGPVTLAPTGVLPTSAVGAAALAFGFNLVPAGVASVAAFGSPVLGGLVTLAPSGVGSLTSVGTPQLLGLLGLAPSSVGPVAAIGTPIVARFLTLAPAGIGRIPLVGTPFMTSRVFLGPVGFESVADVGILEVVHLLDLAPDGVGSLAEVGIPFLQLLAYVPYDPAVEPDMDWARRNESGKLIWGQATLILGFSDGGMLMPGGDTNARME